MCGATRNHFPCFSWFLRCVLFSSLCLFLCFFYVLDVLALVLVVLCLFLLLLLSLSSPLFPYFSFSFSCACSCLLRDRLYVEHFGSLHRYRARLVAQGGEVEGPSRVRTKHAIIPSYAVKPLSRLRRKIQKTVSKQSDGDSGDAGTIRSNLGSWGGGEL